MFDLCPNDSHAISRESCGASRRNDLILYVEFFSIAAAMHFKIYLHFYDKFMTIYIIFEIITDLQTQLNI